MAGPPPSPGLHKSPLQPWRLLPGGTDAPLGLKPAAAFLTGCSGGVNSPRQTAPSLFPRSKMTKEWRIWKQNSSTRWAPGREQTPPAAPQRDRGLSSSRVWGITPVWGITSPVFAAADSRRRLFSPSRLETERPSPSPRWTRSRERTSLLKH